MVMSDIKQHVSLIVGLWSWLFLSLSLVLNFNGTDEEMGTWVHDIAMGLRRG